MIIGILIYELDTSSTLFSECHVRTSAAPITSEVARTKIGEGRAQKKQDSPPEAVSDAETLPAAPKLFNCQAQRARTDM